MKPHYFLLLFLFIASFGNAQIIYHHATVYTVDSTFSQAEAFAVSRGKIMATGKLETLQQKFPEYKLQDMQGKFIYPGFIDAHCHFLGLGLSRQMVELKDTRSMDEVIAKCKSFYQKNPGAILFGRGWDQNDWANKNFPDNILLNKIFPDAIVILKRIDGHAAICNDKALQLAGINCNTTVDGGEIICINNKPTGVLIDNAVDLVMKYVPALDESYIEKSLLIAQSECLKYGLTSVVDAGLELDTLLKIKNIYEKNGLKIRFNGMFSASDKCFDYIFKSSRKITTLGNYHNPQLADYFNVRGIKIYADGALGSRGACLKQPYNDRHDHHGFFLTTYQSYMKWIPLAYKKNLQLNVHCIGDSAASYVMTLMGKRLQTKNDLRWRIEHAQVISESDLQKFKTYDIIPSVQPTHATSDMPWAEERLGAKRMGDAYAYKKLLSVSKFIALGTDFPVEDVSTFKTFYAAVARKNEQGNPKEGFQITDALTREETLKGMTIWAAKSVFEEKNRGSLEAGKWADFIVLDKDIMQIKQDEILQLKVVATYIAGEKVFEN